jgi:uncharacterized RDD family membrane protein YckC
MVGTRYKTFWRRFGALFIDGLMFRPLEIFAPDVQVDSSMYTAVAAGLIGMVSIVYSTAMHARFGQTVGKMATGVIVLDLTETRGPGLKQSLQRDSLSYGFGLGGIVLFAMVTSVDNRGDSDALLILAVAIGFTALAWTVGEILSTLTNERRRAIHDFIGGTVVVKMNHLSNEEHELIFASLPGRRKTMVAPRSPRAERRSGPPSDSGTGW